MKCFHTRICHLSATARLTDQLPIKAISATSFLAALIIYACTFTVISATGLSNTANAQSRETYGGRYSGNRTRSYPRSHRRREGGYRPRRRRGGGGIGVGIGIGLGTAIIMEGLAAEERQNERRRYREERRKRRRARIVCRKGSVRRGRCVCRKGRSPHRLRKNTYVCRRTVAKPKKPRICKIGRYTRRKCICPSGTKQRRLRKRGMTCIRIATPVTPGPPVSTQPPIVPTDTGTPVPPVPPTRQALTPPVIPPIGANQPIPEFVPDEVLFAVANTAPQTLESAVAQTYGLTILERVPLTLINQRVIRLRIPSTNNVPAIVTALQGDTRITGAQANYLYRAQQQAGSELSGGLQYALTKVKAQRALELARGNGVRIAIIDTGIDAEHPDLTNTITKSYNAIGDRNPTVDDHGTSIAGIIAGRGLVRGIAPDAKLLAIRAFMPGTTGGPRLATSVILLRGIDWALQQNARVLNLSFAGPRDPLLLKALRITSEKKAIIVAAAGNGGAKSAPAYPAAYEEVIAVTATDTTDQLYEKANQGNYIVIASPGVDILAPTTKGAHAMQSGTSFAAAHVSAILALMLERNPALSQDEALAILISTARDLGPPGRDTLFGAGAADAFEALQKLPTTSAKATLRH